MSNGRRSDVRPEDTAPGIFASMAIFSSFNHIRKSDSRACPKSAIRKLLHVDILVLQHEVKL
jgi:hypothetical protein